MRQAARWMLWFFLCVSVGVVLAHVIAYGIVVWLLWVFLGNNF